jgi:hypothetical protein
VAFQRSPSGVRLVDDFRDNLIIDRDDPVFGTMRPQKIEHLRSDGNLLDATISQIEKAIPYDAMVCCFADGVRGLQSYYGERIYPGCLMLVRHAAWNSKA